MRIQLVACRSKFASLCLLGLVGCNNTLPLVESPLAISTTVEDDDIALAKTSKLTEPKQPMAPSIPIATSAVMPSPGRTNPFELSSEFQEQSQTEVSGGKRDIRVAGFVEVDEPVVMLLIDGKTHSFKKGETHLRITVNEIMPPRVRLTYDNVTWNASLFDRNSPGNTSP